MTYDNITRSERSMIPLLLLLAVLLISENDNSLSMGLSPTPSSTRTMGRIQEAMSREPTTPPFSSVFSLFSSAGNDYQASASSPSFAPATASDDRRNESLEQGHHPLWSLNLNLDSLAKQGAGGRAQELLRRIHALYTEGYYEVSPDIVSYNSVLKAWKEDEQPEAALELLETMIRNEREAELSDEPNDGSSSNNKNIRVDTISFNTVIAAFANQGDYHKALELLRKMQKKKQNPLQASDFEDDNGNNDGYYYPDPDTITYNIVLYGLAQSDDIGTAAQAENLLREMMLRKERTGMSLVDTMSFNTVLYAWSREGGKSRATPSAEASPTDERTKRQRAMQPKRPVSASMAAQRAESMLTIMEELSEAGNVRVRPDVYSYTTTIQCWARCTDPGAGASNTDKAQAILNRMIERGLEPNKLTYTALINALSKAGLPERAEYVLHQMTQANHPPDTVAFSAIIDGWARVSADDRPEAATRALKILETMRGNVARGIGPTATTYTSVLNALAKSGARDASDRALDLLREMEEEYAAASGGAVDRDGPPLSSREAADARSDKWSLRPTNIHYNCVLNAYAKSSRSDKAVKAQQLMTVMERHSRSDCRPDTISYNSVMMACAHATGNRKMKVDSFKIALRTFKILVSGDGDDDGHRIEGARRSLGPTSTTFAHFFRACRKLLHPNHVRRVPFLTKGLVLCRKQGMLNFLVVHQVQLACQSEASWTKIAGELSEHVGWKEDFRRCGKKVPRAWTCHARR